MDETELRGMNWGSCWEEGGGDKAILQSTRWSSHDCATVMEQTYRAMVDTPNRIKIMVGVGALLSTAVVSTLRSS